jgi:hypothetical protein
MHAAKKPLLVTPNVDPSSPILVTLIGGATFLLEPHGVTYQKTAFLKITVAGGFQEP